MGRHSKGELDIHSARISLDRRVDERSDLRERDYIVQFGIDLSLSHPEDGSVEIDVLPARHLGVEAGTDLKHRRYPAVYIDLTRSRSSYPRQEFEESALARAVPSYYPEGFSPVDSKIYIIKRKKSGVPLRILIEQSASYLPQPVLFAYMPDPDRYFFFFIYIVCHHHTVSMKVRSTRLKSTSPAKSSTHIKPAE